MNKKTVRDIDLKGKTVIMRVDFNVPQDENLNVTDNTRIQASLPTIRYILDQGSKLIIISHIGRPKGKVVEKLRIAPIGKELSKVLKQEIVICNDCIGEEVKAIVNRMKPGEVVLLENLRFHKEETENDPQFAKELASLADVYVNDAFGTAHRAHASIEGIAKYIPAVSGFLLEQELQYLGKALSHPERPFVVIVGGSKVFSKIGILEALLDKLDILIIGGGLNYTFCKAKGQAIGASILDEKDIDTAKQLMDKAKAKGVDLIIPVDHVIADRIDNNARIEVVKGDIPDGFMGLDIGPETIELIKAKLKTAKTVLWNGPLGVFEIESFSKGTYAVAQALGEVNGITIVGGGDLVAAINQSGVADRITHISTGGGASIEYIEGKKLPGIEVLNNKE